MENKMAEVAKLLGVELDEEFRIEHLSTKYKLSKGGLKYWSGSPKKWNDSGLLEDLIIGTLTIIKISKPTLDDVEKEYLSNIIRPFRKNIITIRKVDYYEHEYIEILIYRPGEIVSCEAISFPYFNKGKMYKGMKIDKEYALDELGL